MTKLLAGCALVCAALITSGCAGMPGITAGASTKDFLAHIETCKRHYTGTISATGVNGSLDIQCDPAGPGLQSPAAAAP